MNTRFPARITNARFSKGFTLLELMIVVIVVATLAALAMDNYNRYGFRSRRVDGQNLLMTIAAAEERYYNSYNQYASSITAALPSGLGLTDVSDRGYYTASIGSLGSGNLTYTLTATPVSGKAQTKDQCQKLTLDSTQKKDFSGKDSNGKCW